MALSNVINSLVALGTTSLTGTVKLSSVQTAVTAHAGGGQTNATAITGVLVDVATVGTAADSVKLPASAVGLIVFIKNSGANSMQVFGAGSDTIDGAAAGTGVAQGAGTGAVYFCPAAGVWYQILGA